MYAKNIYMHGKKTLLFGKNRYKWRYNVPSMTYRTSAKKRRTKRIFERLKHILTFWGRTFSSGEKILLIGLIIATVGVWKNWIAYTTPEIFGNGFHELLGMTGYILIWNTFLILFLLFGGKTKEQCKNYFRIYAKDSILIVCFLGANFLFTLNGFFIINNTIMLQTNIHHESGIIVTMVGYLLAIFWGIMSIYFTKSEKMYIDQSLKDEENIPQEHNSDHNMKLPF